MNISTDAWHQIVESVQTNHYTDTHLDLSGLALNSVNIKQLAVALQHNTFITSLDLHNNKLGDLGIKALAANTTLISLDVSQNLIAPNLVAIAKEKAANELLMSMGLEPLPNAPIFPGIQALAANTTLLNLNIADNDIGLEGAEAIAANTTLTSLNIADNDIGLEGAKILAANTTLSNLNISLNGIGPKGAEAIAANTTLTSLNIADNDIGLEGAEAIAANTTLTSLNIALNGIGPKGAEAIAANTTLTSLNIEDNSIEVQGAQALAANTTLRNLDVTLVGCKLLGALYNERGHEIGEEGLAMLAHTKLINLNVGYSGMDNDSWHKLLIEIESNQYTDSHLTLKGLSLHGLRIKQLVDALEENSYITSLDLSSNSPIPKTMYWGALLYDPILLQDSSVKLLANNTTLRSLNMSDNEMSWEAANALANSKTLTSLEISGYEIGPEGVSVIPDMKRSTPSKLFHLNTDYKEIDLDQVEKLLIDIEHNEYTDSDLKLNDLVFRDADSSPLVQAFDLSAIMLAEDTALISLDISHNALGNDAVEAFATHMTLADLNVSNNKIGLQGIEVLEVSTTLVEFNIEGNTIREETPLLSEDNALDTLSIAHHEIVNEDRANIEESNVINLNQVLEEIGTLEAYELSEGEIVISAMFANTDEANVLVPVPSYETQEPILILLPDNLMIGPNLAETYLLEISQDYTLDYL